MTGVTLSMDHKEPQVSPTEVVNETRTQSGKHKIWALAGVLVTLAVIGGIVTIVVVLLNHSERILEKSMILQPAPGVKINETIRVNADKRTEEFNDKKFDMKVLHDFKKGLSVYRMSDGRGSHYCVVTALESDKVRSPEDTYDALNQNSVEGNRIQAVTYDNTTTDEDESDDKTKLWYQFNDANVEERGFLNDDMRAVCSGNELYWAIKSNKPADNQKENGVSEDTQLRHKRATYRIRYCRITYGSNWVRVRCWIIIIRRSG